MICIKHGQIYHPPEYCPYCGAPYKIVTSDTTNPAPQPIEDRADVGGGE